MCDNLLCITDVRASLIMKIYGALSTVCQESGRGVHPNSGHSTLKSC